MKTWLATRWLRPRKAGLFLALFVVLLLGALFLVKRPRVEPIPATKTPISREQVKKLTLDSDTDGLKDWEETIFRTDKDNPDTDGDGTKDGDEIKKQRNPLVKGPNDTMVLALPPKAEDEGTASDLNNLTNKIAEKFGINVLIPRLTNPSGLFDPESVGDQIVSETNLLPEQIYLKEKEIHVTQDNSPEMLKKYDEATTAAAEPFLRFTRTPLEIFSIAIQEDDLSSLSSLDPYLEAYKKMAIQLKDMSVPSKFLSFHYRYANAILRQEDAVKKMRGADKDIISAVAAAQVYVDTYWKVTNSSKEFYQLYGNK